MGTPTILNIRHLLLIAFIGLYCSNQPIIINPENNPREGHHGFVLKVKFSPDGKYIASGGNDSDLLLWDGRTGNFLGRLPGNYDKIFDLTFLNNNREIISGNYLGNLIVWNIASGQKKSIKLDNDFISSLDVSFSENLFFTSSWDKSLKVLNLKDYSIVRECKAMDFKVRGIRYSSTLKTIYAATTRGFLVRWPLETCSEGDNFEEKVSKEALTSLDINDDLNLLVTGSTDSTLKLFNLDTLKLIATLRGHKSQVNTVKILPKKSLIISGDKDGKIYLWDIKSHSKKIMTAHVDSINTLDMSPDERFIVSGSSDNSVKLWDVDKILNKK